MLIISGLFSQVLVEEPISKYQNDDYGFTISVAQQGMGIGGFYNKNIASHTYLGLHGAAFKMRDKFEYSYNLYYYTGIDYNYTANRYNNLYLFPVIIELKHNFMVETFQNDIRPAVFLQGGTIFGMNFPQKQAVYTFDGVKIPDGRENEYEIGFNIGIGASLDVATGKRVYVAIKPLYNWIYFTKSIATQNWHNTFEIALIIGVRK